MKSQFQSPLRTIASIANSKNVNNQTIQSVSRFEKKQMHLKLKFNSNKINHSVSVSRVSKISSKSTNHDTKNFHIKLPNSFYNDSKTKFYLDRSRTLSQKSMCYQVRPMSFSQRKKLQENRLEKVVKKRNTQYSSYEKENTQEKKEKFTHSIFIKPQGPQYINRSKSSTCIKSFTQRSLNQAQRTEQSQQRNNFSQTQRHKAYQNKFRHNSSQKHNKLLHGTKLKQIEQKLLTKEINKISSQKITTKRWHSPFLQSGSNSLRQKFLGRDIVKVSLGQRQEKGKQIINMRNQNKTQLKVLNIDRMFRQRNGKLDNIVPLPVIKLSQVTSRKNVNLLTKSRDGIHDIIEQFNRLLGMAKLKKAKGSSKILGVKGNNFTKNPTFQQLMGLKLKPKSTLHIRQSQQIPSQVFISHCQSFKSSICPKFSLTDNLISGLKQHTSKFSLQVLTRFYSLFINKISPLKDKIQFFQYFFIPHKKQKTTKRQMLNTLRQLCKGGNLPSVNLNVCTEALTEQQKRNVFFEALVRVLFSQVEVHQEMLTRDGLRKIFCDNQQAVQLLFRLIQNDD